MRRDKGQRVRKLEALGRLEGSGETSCEGGSVLGRVLTIQMQMFHVVWWRGRGWEVFEVFELR